MAAFLGQSYTSVMSSAKATLLREVRNLPQDAVNHVLGYVKELRAVREGLADLKAGRVTSLKAYVARRFGTASRLANGRRSRATGR